MAILVAAEAFVLALLVLLVVGLLRSHAEILRRLHDLGAGADDGARPARRRSARTAERDQFRVLPEVPSPGERDDLPAGRDLAGLGVTDDAVSIRVVGVDHATLVAFLSTGCLTCSRFWDAFSRPAELGLADGVRLVIVTRSPTEESAARIAELAPRGIPLVMSSESWDAYAVPGSPYFVLVDGPTGRARGEGTGIDWPQVRNLLGQVADDDTYARELGAAAVDRDRVAKPGADAAREQRVDDELLAAGVRPGDPTLYEAPGPDPQV